MYDNGMGKVTVIAELVLAYCDFCGKQFTPRISRKIRICPRCKNILLGTEGVPLRGSGVMKVISEKIEKAVYE